MMTVTDRYIHTDEVHNLSSPNIIVPHLIEMLHPVSVVDVGCGTGTFLKVFRNHHVNELLGIDGSWVNPAQLHIERGQFMEADLEKPVRLQRNFDLVLCLEVAEHLDPAASDTLIGTLVSLGKVIVFSAATPMQGGQNHINEQPISFWQEKFAQHGYAFYDSFRDTFWNIGEMEWWYKQNMFLVAHHSVMFPGNIAATKAVKPLDIHIHPDLLKLHVRDKQRAIQRWQKQKQALKSFSSGNEALGLYGIMLLRKLKNLVSRK
jgi:SAM-dependent methyltransferase